MKQRLVTSDCPPGRSGLWEVRQFSVSEQESAVDRIRSWRHFGRYTPPGRYTGLFRRHRNSKPTHKLTPIMSDTPDEVRDHARAIQEARVRGGHVLVNGLGLGLVVQAMLQDEDPWQRKQKGVDRLTVIEREKDVIALVGDHLQERFGARLEIVQADAVTWKPPRGKRYTVAWHDIWSSICADNLAEMMTLHRRYGRRVDWQGSWGRALCERLAGRA